MFNRYILISLSIFFTFMILTSVVKNNTRNIEKTIEKLNLQVNVLEKELMDSEIDYIYLSTPENLTKKISNFENEKYFEFDHSRIFLSTKEFINYNSKQTKNFTEKKKYGKK
tara:strand:+ start:208 stop:543 length:336 start_codon:yes stop_codon:yes gene_type:complete